MLRDRVLVALVGIPVILAVIYYGGLSFLLLVDLIIVLGLWEFYKLTQAKGASPFKIPGILAGLLLSWSIYLSNAKLFSLGGLLPNILFLLFIFIFFLFSLFKKSTLGAMLNIAVTLLGLIYVAWLGSHLILLRELTRGRNYIFFLFLVIWAIDNSAYFVGLNWGRRRFFARISPRKTLEGFLGGLAGGVVVSLLYKWIWWKDLNYAHCFMLALLLGLVAQLSDLSESLLKRDAGVKDSSGLLPGHGGILDRFDSFFFSAPFFYYYIHFFLG